MTAFFVSQLSLAVTKYLTESTDNKKGFSGLAAPELSPQTFGPVVHGGRSTRWRKPGHLRIAGKQRGRVQNSDIPSKSKSSDLISSNLSHHLMGSTTSP